MVSFAAKFNRILRLAFPCLLLVSTSAAQTPPQTLSGWRMQEAAKVNGAANAISGLGFSDAAWFPATVPGTVLTTLVDNKVYPEPLYGENMRA